MGFISRQIEKMYKGVLFRRHDPDGSVFYFSERDFPGLVAEEFSFLSKRGHKLFGNFYHLPLRNRKLTNSFVGVCAYSQSRKEPLGF